MTFSIMRLSITIKNATQGALVIVTLSVANKTLILCVIMVSFVMLSVVKLSVIMPSVVAPLYILVTYPSKM